MMIRQPDVEPEPGVFLRPVGAYGIARLLVFVSSGAFARGVVLADIFKGILCVPHRPLGVVKIWLFGSRIRRDAHAPAFIEQNGRPKACGVEDCCRGSWSCRGRFCRHMRSCQTNWKVRRRGMGRLGNELNRPADGGQHQALEGPAQKSPLVPRVLHFTSDGSRFQEDRRKVFPNPSKSGFYRSRRIILCHCYQSGGC